MKYLQSTVIIAFLFATIAANAQYQKTIDKAEEQYEVGNYSAAGKLIAKTQKKVTKNHKSPKQ